MDWSNTFFFAAGGFVGTIIGLWIADKLKATDDIRQNIIKKTEGEDIPNLAKFHREKNKKGFGSKHYVIDSAGKTGEVPIKNLMDGDAAKEGITMAGKKLKYKMMSKAEIKEKFTMKRIEGLLSGTGWTLTLLWMLCDKKVELEVVDGEVFPIINGGEYTSPLQFVVVDTESRTKPEYVEELS